MLIVSDRVSGGIHQLVNMASGAYISLPRAVANEKPLTTDIWYASNLRATSRTLVRRDEFNDLAFVSGDTGVVLSEFGLSTFVGVNRPSFKGPVRVSPDGQRVLFAWQPDRDDSDTIKLSAFNRQGKELNAWSIPKAVYEGNYTWLDNATILFYEQNGSVLSTVSLETGELIKSSNIIWPSKVEASSWLNISPDGTTLAWAVTMPFKNDAGAENPKSTIWLSSVDGKNLRQLTTVTDKERNLPVQSPMSTIWAPSSKALAVHFGDDTHGGVGLPTGCHDMRLISTAATSLVALDSVEISPKLAFPKTGALDPVCSLVGPEAWID